MGVSESSVTLVINRFYLHKILAPIGFSLLKTVLVVNRGVIATLRRFLVLQKVLIPSWWVLIDRCDWHLATCCSPAHGLAQSQTFGDLRTVSQTKKINTLVSHNIKIYMEYTRQQVNREFLKLMCWRKEDRQVYS